MLLKNFLPGHYVYTSSRAAHCVLVCVFHFLAFLELSISCVYCTPDENDKPFEPTNLSFFFLFFFFVFVNLCCFFLMSSL